MGVVTLGTELLGQPPPWCPVSKGLGSFLLMGFSGLAQVLINNLTLGPPPFPWVWGWMQWRDGGLPLHTSLLSRDPQLWARNTQIHRELGLARLCFSHRLRCPVICTLQEGSCSRSPSDKCWGQAGTQAQPAHYPLPLTAPQCSLRPPSLLPGPHALRSLLLPQKTLEAPTVCRARFQARGTEQRTEAENPGAQELGFPHHWGPTWEASCLSHFQRLAEVGPA